VKIGDHDLQIKINHAREFLKENNKVQFTLQFRGREVAHMDLGREIFKKIKTELLPYSKVERDTKLEGRRMTLVLQPEHKSAAAAAKPGGPSAPGTKPAGPKVTPSIPGGAAVARPQPVQAAVAPAALQ
jgi:translation initiation factor IF-3